MVDQKKADAFVHAVVRDWRTAPLTACDRALCQFAAKLTHLPRSMSEADVQTLRSLGLTDRAIHDVVQVISCFNYFTRIADALGVEPETFIKPWGKKPAG